MLFVLLAAILVYLVHDMRPVREMEKANLDSWLRSRSPSWSNAIFIVPITDEDYRDLFNSQSPLRPDIVQRLVGRIIAGGAEIVIVDLDTSTWDPKQAEAWRKKLPLYSRVIWARDADFRSEGISHLDPVLGSSMPENDLCWGVPTGIEQEAVVREFSTELDTNSQGSAISLAAVAASMWKDLEMHGDGQCRIYPAVMASDATFPDYQAVNINYSLHKFHMSSAGELLQLGKTEAWLNPGSNAINGKIVVLGGSYKAARDTYNTPVGKMEGIKILAHSIDTLLPAQQLAVASKSQLFFLDLCLGAGLLLLCFPLPRTWALLIYFLAFPILAFIVSYFAFHLLGSFVSFIPVLIAVLVHELLEHYRDHWRHAEEPTSGHQAGRKRQQHAKAAAAGR